MAKHRIFTTEFAKVYPLYVQKAERKNRTKDEVDQVIRWLTGYDQAGLEKQISQQCRHDREHAALADALYGPKRDQLLDTLSRAAQACENSTAEPLYGDATAIDHRGFGAVDGKRRLVAEIDHPGLTIIGATA